MSESRAHAFARDWIVPGGLGLAGAAVVIAGAEIGGPIGWVLIGLAGLALVSVVVWAVRTFYMDDWTDDAP